MGSASDFALRLVSWNSSKAPSENVDGHSDERVRGSI